ncbi:hypothetical protein B0H19DRAFT_1348928 [Mycena capillaripes]|nr:hypothetical protein B0H19DRAFT_1348928 [Mycena capillaripes]
MAPPPPHVDECVLFASMSRYWAGDNAWTNPPSQALPQRRKGSGGSSEYGSGERVKIESKATVLVEYDQKWPQMEKKNGSRLLYHKELSFETFQESTSAFVPPLASDLEQYEQDFETLPESTSNHSSLDWDSDLVGTHFPKSSLQPHFDVKGLSSDDGHTPYELTPDEIDVVIGHTNASVTSSSARDCWPWRDSAILWMDPGVSSKVVDFPDGFPITTKTKVFHIELERHTLTISHSRGSDRVYCLYGYPGCGGQEKTIDAILKDCDPHSYGGSTGPRREPEAFITGSLFGPDPSIRVACGREEAKCNGVVASQSLDAAFLSAPCRFPDPVYCQALIAAEMRTREL